MVRCSAYLSGVLLLVGSLAFAADNPIRQPKFLAWEKSDASSIGTRRTTECLNTTHEMAAITLGRIAFNSPRLLGGQAGRMGLSCNSCHLAGRNNERFFIEQFSDQPGTVDVTHAFFSLHSEDQRFNPVVIPNLSDRSQLSVPQTDGVKFAAHIHKLITMEFDGQPPIPPVLDGLLTYMRALDQKNCQIARESETLESHIAITKETLELLSLPAVSEDKALTSFLLKSFRAQLEVLYDANRTAEPELDAQIIQLSRQAEGLMVSKQLDEHQLILLQQQTNALLNALPASIYWH